jgi:hypothetical protein
MADADVGGNKTSGHLGSDETLFGRNLNVISLEKAFLKNVSAVTSGEVGIQRNVGRRKRRSCRTNLKEIKQTGIEIRTRW